MEVGRGLADREDMDFIRMLDRCRSFEERAAALYRRFAADARAKPELCALWTEMAREEEAHARSLTAVAQQLRPIDVQHIRLDGWTEALDEVADRLVVAEGLPPGAPVARQLVAALDLERTELDAARYALLAASGLGFDIESHADHAARFALAASRYADPAVLLASALLRARALLTEHDRATA
jgi:hypothetical protein